MFEYPYTNSLVLDIHVNILPIDIHNFQALPTRPTVDSCCHAGNLWRLQATASIGGRAEDWGSNQW